MTRAPQPTGKTPSNHSWRAAAGGRRLQEMLGMLGAAARRGLRRATQLPSGVKPLTSLQICGYGALGAASSSAWLEPRAVTGWRKRARGSQVAAKCLISLKTTGEQSAVLSTVGRGGAHRPTPGGGLAIEMLFRARGPLRATKGLIFLGSSKMLERPNTKSH